MTGADGARDRRDVRPARSERDVGAVVLTGEPPAFCSGADVSSLGALAASDADDRERGTVVSIYEGFLRVLRSPLPTVAAVNGPAVGAGMNLALACDVRLAGASARFDARFLRSACTPAAGTRGCSNAPSARRPPPRSCCSASRSTGARAVEIGLAWRCHPDDELLAAARDARGAARPRSRRRCRPRPSRRSAQVPWQPDFDAALATEVERQTWSLGQGWFNAAASESRGAAQCEVARRRARGRAPSTPRPSSRSGRGPRRRPGSGGSRSRCLRRGARASPRRAGSAMLRGTIAASSRCSDSVSNA